MSTIFYSTFITGFEKVIEEALLLRLKKVIVQTVGDGFIVYRTDSSMDDIKRLKFLNNSFVFLKKMEGTSGKTINDLLLEVIKDKAMVRDIHTAFKGKRHTIRIRASVENQFVGVDKALQKKVEQVLIGQGNLTVDRSLADLELWVSMRKEGFTLFGVRFTKRANYEKTLAKGELYPELTYLLCLLSDPKKEDVFLDPFCGSGAIALQRASSFPCKQVLAGDVDASLVNALRKRIERSRNKITVGRWDARKLATFDTASVDAVVTDPPWGNYGTTDIDLDALYHDMLIEFSRVLKPYGTLVVLTAQYELFESKLADVEESLVLIAQYHTLVSGRKAGVFVVKRAP
ncbi:MAG: methyltransferase domain-containing protein [Candidatus Roizmanbacteria bacterium]|nr:methyltransferase domain-containing protein [Candidatus Roizmanbacteria bacterium]